MFGVQSGKLPGHPVWVPLCIPTLHFHKTYARRAETAEVPDKREPLRERGGGGGQIAASEAANRVERELRRDFASSEEFPAQPRQRVHPAAPSVPFVRP